MVTCLTLLDGGIQADLLANRGTNGIHGSMKKERMLPTREGGAHLPQRTSASGPCVAAGRVAGRWCREFCSQRSYHEGEGKSGRFECHI